jgi:purine-binding chemotaxis protein CheW
MHEPTPIQWDASGELAVLTFDLERETFAIEAVLVREILDLLPETVVPGAPSLVGSVVNFRGRIIPVADLRLAFGMPRAETSVDSRIVVMEIELDDEVIQIGVRTDKVHEVTSLDQAASEEPPAVGMRWRRDFVRALVRRSDGVIVLPDLPSIFRSISGGGDLAAGASSTTH